MLSEWKSDPGWTDFMQSLPSPPFCLVQLTILKIFFLPLSMFPVRWLWLLRTAINIVFLFSILCMIGYLPLKSWSQEINWDCLAQSSIQFEYENVKLWNYVFIGCIAPTPSCSTYTRSWRQVCFLLLHNVRNPIFRMSSFPAPVAVSAFPKVEGILIFLKMAFCDYYIIASKWHPKWVCVLSVLSTSHMHHFLISWPCHDG